MVAIERRVREVAARQHGVIARRQALGMQLAPTTLDRRIAEGEWMIIAPGVYRATGSPDTTRAHLMAATLQHPGALVSHDSASHLLRLDGYDGLAELSISLPRTAGVRAQRHEVAHDDERAAWRLRVHRPLDIAPIDRLVVDGIPCTAAARTLIDLAGPLRGERLEAAFESARRMGLVSVEHLARRAGELCGRGKRGSALIRALVADAAGTNRALESRLELKTWRLWRSTSLPRPVRQRWVDLPDGSSARIDFALDAVKIGVEAEGYDFHGNRLRWKRDHRRVAMLESLGWRLVVVTWDDVTRHPVETVDRIRAAIAERGAFAPTG